MSIWVTLFMKENSDKSVESAQESVQPSAVLSKAWKGNHPTSMAVSMLACRKVSLHPKATALSMPRPPALSTR